MTNTTFIEGRSEEKARSLLSKAREAGLAPGTIRTTSDGYIVPASLLGDPSTETPEPEEQEVEEGQFDPSEHSVAKVEEYLESADADERKRVLAAERDGKARKSLVDNDSDSEEKN